MVNIFYKKGITAIELLIVLGILGILISVVLPQFSKLKEDQVLKSATSDVLSALDKARSQTLSSLNSSEYGVHFQSNQIIIFKGIVFSSNDVNNETIGITSPASISNVSWGVPATSGDVYFNRLSGTPSATGTVTISSTHYSKIITISTTGVTNSN